MRNVNRTFAATVTLPAFCVVKHPVMRLTQRYQIVLDILFPESIGVSQMMDRCGRLATYYTPTVIKRQSISS